MTTAKKKTTKRKSAEEESAPPAPPRYDQPTLTQIHYHPELGKVRAHIEQDVEVLGTDSRHGRDVDIAFDDLSADIRSALDDAFAWIAEDVKATPYEAPEPTEE